MPKKFDAAAAVDEEVLIRYYYDGLKPFIHAQSDKQGRNLDI